LQLYFKVAKCKNNDNNSKANIINHQTTLTPLITRYVTYTTHTNGKYVKKIRGNRKFHDFRRSCPVILSSKFIRHCYCRARRTRYKTHYCSRIRPSVCLSVSLCLSVQ